MRLFPGRFGNIFISKETCAVVTEKLFWEDQTMKEFQAKVLSCEGEEVILDRTAFYPRGGGQPADTGVMRCNGSSFTVSNVEKRGDDVIHTITGENTLKPGDIVTGEIDWDRRYSHMRYHTAIHVLDGIITQRHNDEGMLTGGQIYQDRARIDFDMDDLTREKVESLIEETNEAIRSGLKVYSKEIPGKEALDMPNIFRTLPGRELLEKLEKIRIVVIEGLDEQADGGTHVSSTSEVGKIVFRNLKSKGKRNKRVEFILEDVTS